MPSSVTMDSMLPKVVVFDLDGTLWNPEMYQLWGGGGAPFRRDGDHHGHVLDRSNTKVKLLGETRTILQMLHRDPAWKGTLVGVSSTCDEPSWARECLQLFTLDDERKIPFSVLFAGLECIYSDRKSNHFRKLLQAARQRDSTIRDDFSDFIFFDNQTNNIHDVGQLGVTCVYCPDGMQPGVWERGLAEWRQRRQRGSGKADL